MFLRGFTEVAVRSPALEAVVSLGVGNCLDRLGGGGQTE